MIVYRNILKGYFFWSIPFLFFSCSSAPVQTVKATDPKNCEWYVVHTDNKEANKNNQLDLYTIRFYSDGAYTLCAALLFEQGKWSYDTQKKLLVLQPLKADSETRYLVDQTLPDGKTQFSFYHGYPIDKTNPDEMVKVHAVQNQSKADPYSQAVQSWRQQPALAETPKQIQQRVLAYLQFLQSLYTHAQENALENVGGNWYPQPIHFYTNKVSMAYANELIDWYACFFNEEQAVQGYQLMSGALMRIKIKGTDDVDRNLNCINQMIQLVQK